MARPSAAEIAKKQKELEYHLRQLADPETGRQKPTAIVNAVRGAIRKSWMKSPIKLAYYEMGREPDTDTNACKWKMKCEYCKRYYRTDQIAIDHKNGNHTFTCAADFEKYHDNILDVTFDELQRLCDHRCHSVKTQKETAGHPDMRTAAVDKVNLFIIKYTDTKSYTKWLLLNNIDTESSAAKRRVQGFELLKSLPLNEEEFMDLFEACDLMHTLQAKSKKKRFSIKPSEREMVGRYLGVWQANGLFAPNLTLTAYKG